MTARIRYLTHPEVVIDPHKDIRFWSLSAQGRARVQALADSGILAGTRRVISSAEVKALETAEPLARSLGCEVEICEGTHENDRSATGFLPPLDFEAVADAFFAKPEQSIRGWETALAAQMRIVTWAQHCLAKGGAGDVLFVGHGAVGTLLWCHLAGKAIDRTYDQKAGGGCIFDFAAATHAKTGWTKFEDFRG